MPSATPRSVLTIRPRPVAHDNYEPKPRNLKHRPCGSFTDANELLSSINYSNYQHPVQSNYHATLPTIDSHLQRNERPAKRSMPTPKKTIAVVNASGRQAASFIRVAAAVGYNVRAQLRNLDGIVASEIEGLDNVTVLVGDLYTKTKSARRGSPTLSPADTGINHELINDLFKGANLAFINTTFWGDEVAIGKAIADAALKVNIEHFIYSSMPDHALITPPNVSKPWPSLPLWNCKMEVEQYIRTIPALLAKTTFIYTGIYNNNFTSLLYPLFCTELQPDGSFVWTAPFHPDVPLPWLDAEHDVGPAVIQLIKDGVQRWGKGERIALAYEMLTPKQVCRAFSRGVQRPVRYRHSLKIEVKVKIPTGYRDQLVALEEMYALGAKDPKLQPPYFGDPILENSCPHEAMELWEGHRGIEEYAREVFPLEEAANGLTWMNEEEEEEGRIEGGDDLEEVEEEDDEDEGLTMGGGTDTPARQEEGWLA